MRYFITFVVFVGFLSLTTFAHGQYHSNHEINNQIEMIKKNFLDSNLDILEKQIDHFGEEQVEKMISMIETGDFDHKFFLVYMDDLLSLKLNLIDSSLKTAEFEINLLEISSVEKQKLINEFRDVAESAKYKITLEHESHKSNISLVDSIVDISSVSIPLILDHQEEIEEFGNNVSNVVVQQVEENSKGGGCLIATATYGSEMSQQVQQLRELRDNQLLQTESGTAFMGAFNDIYYSFSPTIADMEREHPMFKEAVKLAITPMISTLSLMENAETESEVLSIGISVIALNLAMYLGVPAIVVIGIRIRKRF